MISNNFCGGQGGGVFNFSNPMIMINNTVIDNESGLGGNSIFTWMGEAILINNIIWSDIENSQPDFLYKKDETSKIWGYNNVLKNPDELGNKFYGSGNIFDKPIFSDDFYGLAVYERIGDLSVSRIQDALVSAL